MRLVQISIRVTPAQAAWIKANGSHEARHALELGILVQEANERRRQSREETE